VDAGLEVSFEGLTLHVKDVERSREFYERIPGVVLQHRRPGEFALFRIGESWLGLLQLGAPGFHLEFVTADLDSLYTNLRRNGVEPKGRPQTGAGGSARSWWSTLTAIRSSSSDRRCDSASCRGCPRPRGGSGLRLGGTGRDRADPFEDPEQQVQRGQQNRHPHGDHDQEQGQRRRWCGGAADGEVGWDQVRPLAERPGPENEGDLGSHRGPSDPRAAPKHGHQGQRSVDEGEHQERQPASQQLVQQRPRLEPAEDQSADREDP